MEEEILSDSKFSV